MKRITTLLIAVLALSSVVLVSTASAHRAKFDTSVSAKYEKPNKNDPYDVASFNGALNSEKPRCERGRTVTLLMRTTTGSTTVGTAVSDASGAWTIAPTSVVPGTYFAQVKKKVLRKNSKHSHVCKAGVSRDVKVK